ncbi:conserved hypothetical protein [Leishmania braziliensis MHOM/BR/75/M2904]|uniref:Uncharacterized protein n=2 Tax=Leishmania braziliensis TaxID=5660 RepID=A4HQD4_LEIBR|nr:conserved hypothetical protein [Leishmania braziliensis MHOM/BR/75/M2904]KAI5691673.1 hypothetical protein MNV84_08399 [Leishmania braziliensis]CAJ2482228.1 unnamed protein product [Leishmania braziliensis]CAJ2482527.1 unnamed protein product [Leishmania braziliensis]CAM44399.1 conserved hypothetical protein [Leishmania braziliensis MHOM/BR/75/M2904]SYZ70472.1 hypothetical_protein [Leishmania braziliensis MHOM/BR/75/M2904]
MSSASASCATRPDLAEPASLLESLQILRSENPQYMAITHPSTEQVDDLNSVIQCLRLQLDGGVDGATGDETAYELAVALLWHSDKSLIEEGVLLMEYLLKERWDHYWSTVIRRPPDTDVDDDEHGKSLGSDLVESAPEEDGLDDGRPHDDEWLGISGSPSDGKSASSSSAAAAADPCFTHCTNNEMVESAENTGPSVILRGSAVQFATAPPPPEVGYGSAPPSLMRDRAQPSACRWGASGMTVASSCSSATTAAMTSTQCLPKALGASCTSPSTAGSSTHRHSSNCEDAHPHYERLASCYYHLAVGYTKLRKNEKALFYVNNVLRLIPCSEEGQLLRRLLCARLYVQHVFIFTVPLLAVGFLFL